MRVAVRGDIRNARQSEGNETFHALTGMKLIFYRLDESCDAPCQGEPCWTWLPDKPARGEVELGRAAVHFDGSFETTLDNWDGGRVKVALCMRTNACRSFGWLGCFRPEEAGTEVGIELEAESYAHLLACLKQAPRASRPVVSEQRRLSVAAMATSRSMAKAILGRGVVPVVTGGAAA